MSRIHLLPDLLVNKIAAGEVVERPASAIKELLENAVDAGARHVEAAIEDGGKRLIRVTDDAGGMSPEELELAVAPHATSKLTAEDDLYRIETLGFRGEALASIGAVSHLRIVSRQPDSDVGGEIRVAGERIERCGVAGCPPGTSVEVRDLFFNVPARRKFLRTTGTETGHINEQFARIALAYPEVGFELTNGKRVTHRLSADQSRLERIAALHGPELAEDLMIIQRQEHGLLLEAYAARPVRTRATAAGQYVFINGRFIRDRVIAYAVREAYRGLMEPNRHPVVFLFLGIEPAAVDVNVHPTKIEVRWRDGNLIRSQVLSALRETLLQTDLTPALRTDGRPGPTGPLNEAGRDDLRRRMAAEFKNLTPPPLAPMTAPAGPYSGGTPTRPDRGPGSYQPQTAARSEAPSAGAVDEASALWQSLYEQSTEGPAIDPGYAATAPTDVAPVGAAPQATDRAEATSAALTPDPQAALPRPAIQLHNTYLVSETDDGLVIIDQHALHERVLYEQLRQRLTTGPLESQRLLLPETVEATPQQIAVLEAHGELLHRLGVEVSPFGHNAVAIQAFPSLLGDVDARAFIRDLIDKLGRRGDAPHTEVLIHELLDMMACKAAVKAGDPLTRQEIDALIASKDLIEKSSNCPHGRPTTLRLELKDLERQFKRT
ncbi:MAG: DNA mismatch repair endonuclease MutL [bacterium]|nr:DNA mismatch repair endonuclease MutL [bacterium]